MTTATKNNTALATTAMLIRRPASEVFEAFINPEITSKFWFTKGTGKLAPGKQVDWIWEMYDLTVPVSVKSVEPNKSIVVDWGSDQDKSTVEWTFEPFDKNATIVQVKNYGFRGNIEEILTQVRDSTEGFALVLAGLKAWLEHKVQLNLVADRHPKGLGQTA